MWQHIKASDTNRTRAFPSEIADPWERGKRGQSEWQRKRNEQLARAQSNFKKRNLRRAESRGSVRARRSESQAKRKKNRKVFMKWSGLTEPKANFKKRILRRAESRGSVRARRSENRSERKKLLSFWSEDSRLSWKENPRSEIWWLKFFYAVIRVQAEMLQDGQNLRKKPSKKIFRWPSGRKPPVTIPNTVVKTACGENTRRKTARENN